MDFPQWQEIFQASESGIWSWVAEASRFRERHFGCQVSFCVIINAKSGGCSEDCAFCSQAKGSRAEVPFYPLLPQEKLVEAAQAAAAAGAARFSIVTSGRGVTSGKDREAILRAVEAIRRTTRLKVCASLGVVEQGFLNDLKAAGLYRFHHNLETAPSYYARICTTHSFQDRLATVERAKAAGLEVCSGGILGLGESLAQRWELAQTLKSLEVDAVPLNFLHPLPGTPLASRPLMPPLEALKAIVAFRLTLPDRSLIICGGRQVTLRALSPLIFAAGADAVMTGDYLTTQGRLPDDDRQTVADLGLILKGEDQGSVTPAPSPKLPPPTP